MYGSMVKHLQNHSLYLCMLFLGVIQHHAFMALDRVCPLASSKQAVLADKCVTL